MENRLHMMLSEQANYKQPVFRFLGSGIMKYYRILKQ